MDDFYEDDAPYNEAIESLRDTLKESVKKEVQDELRTLREEVGELRKVKQNVDTIKREAEQAKSNAMAEAKSMRFKSIVDQLGIPAWIAKQDNIERPKCDKCNDKRLLHYVTPRGKEQYETCECAGKDSVYRLIETHVISFSVKERAYDPRDQVVYTYATPRYYDADNTDRYETETTKVWSGQGFKSSPYTEYWVFLDKSKAQEYVDYLNKKDAA